MDKSYATLAFPKGGLSAKFRLDPTAVDWSFKVHTHVVQTIGGRVVQVTGATLSDMVITGDFGEDASQRDGTSEPPGKSWRLAVAFSNQIRAMMNYQASDATKQQQMHPTAIFTYPPLGWKFNVYVKAFTDPDGGAITMRPGKFSHSYQLTLFIVQDGSDVVAGQKNGVLSKAKAAAINQYLSRISDGFGWKPTTYNGNFLTYYSGEFANAVTKFADATVTGANAQTAGANVDNVVQVLTDIAAKQNVQTN
jgi:hypothetical protein